MSVLILGHGLLGSELVKQTRWDYISRHKNNFDFIDVNSYSSLLYDYDTIVNSISYTNTYDDNKQKHWDVNYKAVVDLVDMCNIYNKKLIHISTDYIYANSITNASEEDVPVHCRNWYSYTKLLADGYVQLKSNNFLLLRGTHKEEPFLYDSAWTDQVGNFDYVSVISKLIIRLIEKKVDGIYNIGTEVKTMYDLARKTKVDVNPIKKMINISTPTNLVMNLKKLNDTLGDGNGN